jgi:hypothetical protein
MKKTIKRTAPLCFGRLIDCVDLDLVVRKIDGSCTKRKLRVKSVVSDLWSKNETKWKTRFFNITLFPLSLSFSLQTMKWSSCTRRQWKQTAQQDESTANGNTETQQLTTSAFTKQGYNLPVRIIGAQKGGFRRSHGLFSTFPWFWGYLCSANRCTCGECFTICKTLKSSIVSYESGSCVPV